MKMIGSKRFYAINFLFFIQIQFLFTFTEAESHEINKSTENILQIQCINKERTALLQFKDGLIDEYDRLSTWGAEKDCCKWNGVRCDRRSNHVIALNLQGPSVDDFSLSKPLRGKIGVSLLQLVDLRYLDLSNNDFNTIAIPEQIGSLEKLQHLNLSHCNFVGSVPYQLGNLSMLRVLDLNGNQDVLVNDLDWLLGLRLLKHLDLSGLYLYHITTWGYTISKLKTLEKLFLKSCSVQESLQNSTFPSTNGYPSLSVLDLSSNNLGNKSLLWFLNASMNYSFFDFSSNNVQGQIPDALRGQISLSYLDLSSNSFQGNISDALRDMKSLAYLDLSTNSFEGRIPSYVGNMRSLVHLDLSGNKLEGEIPNSLGNLIRISRLNLAWNNLLGGIPQINGNLIHLISLDLSSNKLEGPVSHINRFLQNSTKLEYLDLSSNRLYGSLPLLSRFPSLKILSIPRNELNGSFVEDRLILPNLILFDLSGNRLTGRVPDLASCLALEVLNLSDNMFNGTLTQSIGYLAKLNSLDLHSNRLEGILSEAHFHNASQLRVLDLSHNINLTVKISPRWDHPFQLGMIKLSYCNLGPSFPLWLVKQRQIAHLDISNSHIFDRIPAWFWNNSGSFQYLNVSFNKIYGGIPNLSANFIPSIVDFSSNDFTGSLPVFPSAHKDIVNLSRNKFSGEVNSFCNATYGWTVLDLSNNRLSGKVSEYCFKNLMTTDYLNLGNNNFSGQIPSPTGWACSLSIIHLQNNSFRGELPPSLSTCGGLKIMDVADNYLSGEIPPWIGESLSELLALIMKSNNFRGTFPSTLCYLANLQILDLSFNKLSGAMPRCLNNLTAMTTKPDINEWEGYKYQLSSKTVASIFDNAYFEWRGRVAFYSETNELIKVIDISKNDIVGEIPPEITSLEGVMGLNMSRNKLIGSIPTNIDKLEFLNFVDLSINNLSGGIPVGLSRLYRLGLLDLSFNNLSGRIPWIGYLKKFGASTFRRNSGLCGLPLSKPCPLSF